MAGDRRSEQLSIVLSRVLHSDLPLLKLPGSLKEGCRVGAAGYQPGEPLCKDHLLHSWRYITVNVFPSLLLGNQLNKADCIIQESTNATSISLK